MPPKTHTELIQDLSNTVAAQATTISRLEERLATELRESRESFQEQVGEADEALHQLRVELRGLTERNAFQERETARLREELARERGEREKEREARAALEKEHAVLRQQLQDHIKQAELRDSRRWGLFIALAGVLLGAVLSLASGLIVTLARK
jgi:hypothetical protein